MLQSGEWSNPLPFFLEVPMLLTAIVQRVNELLDGETLSFSAMRPHLDGAIDDINQQMNTLYPVFSELLVGTTEYVYFPDRYLRTVVAYGAACKFYMTDEEGGQPPIGYLQTYQQNMFLMMRDYLNSVPVAYRAPDSLGIVNLSLDGVDSTTNPNVDPEAWRL